jgi:hypothetical protein
MTDAINGLVHGHILLEARYAFLAAANLGLVACMIVVH